MFKKLIIFLVIFHLALSCDSGIKEEMLFKNYHIPNKNISFERNVVNDLKIIDSIMEFEDVFSFQLNTTSQNSNEVAFIKNFEPIIYHFNLKTKNLKKIGDIGESNAEYLDPYQLYFDGIKYIFTDLQDRSIKQIIRDDAEVVKKNILFTNFGIIDENLILYHEEVGIDSDEFEDSFFIVENLSNNEVKRINITKNNNIDKSVYKGVALEGKFVQNERYIANIPFKSSFISVFDIHEKKLNPPIHTIDKTGIANVKLNNLNNQYFFTSNPQDFINLDACLYEDKIYILSNISINETEYYIDVYSIKNREYIHSFEIQFDSKDKPSLIYVIDNKIIILTENLNLKILKIK